LWGKVRKGYKPGTLFTTETGHMLYTLQILRWRHAHELARNKGI
jgi:hypothetical protein